MIQYFLNGKSSSPMERKAIQFKTVFDARRFGEFEMVLTNLTFVNEDKIEIEKWISTYGYSVGMPFSVRFSNGAEKPFFLDFRTAEFRINSIKVDAVVRFENDTFWQKASGLTFSNTNYLEWKESDFVRINFVVVPPDQIAMLIPLAISTLVIAKEIATNIFNLAENAAAIVKAAVPVGAPIPGPDWGAIVVLVLKIALTLVYTIALTVALVKMMNEIMELIFPKVRQFKGIDYFHLIKKGCESLGYTFKSEFLSGIQGLTVLPVPLRSKDAGFFKTTFMPNSLAFTYGYPTIQDSIPTLESAISVIENVFNCKTRVFNSEVRLEQSSYWEQNSEKTIPKAFNIQEDSEMEYTINLDEIFKRKLIVWQNDSTDFNTFDDTRDDISEYNTVSEEFPDNGVDLELIRGLEQVEIPFAKAKRKDNLTLIETKAQVLAKFADPFTKGKASKMVEARERVMQISQLFFNRTKLLIRDGNDIHTNQNAIIGANAIGKYHEGSFGQKALRKIYSGMPVRMNENDFFQIIQNNYLTLDSGEEIEVVAVEWSEESNFATVDYRVKVDNSKIKTTKIA